MKRGEANENQKGASGMETSAREVTASTIKQRLRSRGLTHNDLARAAEISQSAVSGILNGYVRLGPVREARLVTGILRLGLHKETPEPEPKPEAEPVVIHIPAEGGQTDSEKAQAEG